ncbi:ANTAR domain-containing response regulator [Acetivibrio clariflavus]|uniref:Stage 0 sporulation protein A homolog n=1 Tax=Acetivibrio clariflavus (strain DSM 19732 / NBRC 101661 / EBR45) TaxID=720554 RepID=G8M364_ACECE|nr:ANTAR domain-containing protein [Acetivibrio clariflavus]AEV70384.1 response regulator with putative antiterminator output domain [Acetivibrio clariflavus DSM 19732]
MESARILVAMSNKSSNNKLKIVLNAVGYQIVDQADDANDALRKLNNLKPDLAVMEYDLSPQNIIEVAKIAVEDKLSDVILIASSEQKGSLEYLKSEYDIVVIAKPLHKETFLSTVDLVIKNRKKILALEKEIEELKEAIETRKEIEQAKGLLMKNLNLTEEEAFRMIQKQSMNRGIKMKEIARAIILTYNL